MSRTPAFSLARRLLLAAGLLSAAGWAAAGPTLLNVSYDVAREF